MVYNIEVPDKYGYVLLTAVVGQVFTNFYLSGYVMSAREKMDVPYPNLYAVPSYHKRADEFNRIQRGHQNYLEGLPLFMALALVGGLKHPMTATVASVLQSIGSVLYLKGYADTTLDVKTARYKKGGPLKVVGLLAAFGSTVSLIGSMNGWW